LFAFEVAFEENPIKMWDSNIFGKSLRELVNEGLRLSFPTCRPMRARGCRRRSSASSTRAARASSVSYFEIEGLQLKPPEIPAAFCVMNISILDSLINIAAQDKQPAGAMV